MRALNITPEPVAASTAMPTHALSVAEAESKQVLHARRKAEQTKHRAVRARTAQLLKAAANEAIEERLVDKQQKAVLAQMAALSWVLRRVVGAQAGGGAWVRWLPVPRSGWGA